MKQSERIKNIEKIYSFIKSAVEFNSNLLLDENTKITAEDSLKWSSQRHKLLQILSFIMNKNSFEFKRDYLLLGLFRKAQRSYLDSIDLLNVVKKLNSDSFEDINNHQFQSTLDYIETEYKYTITPISKSAYSIVKLIVDLDLRIPEGEVLSFFRLNKGSLLNWLCFELSSIFRSKSSATNRTKKYKTNWKAVKDTAYLIDSKFFQLDNVGVTERLRARAGEWGTFIKGNPDFPKSLKLLENHILSK